MAASVAFLHQAEYEAVLNEYEAEAKRVLEQNEQEEHVEGDESSKQRNFGSAEAAAARGHQALLRRNLIRGQGAAGFSGPRKSSEVASWLSMQHSSGGGGGGGDVRSHIGLQGSQGQPWRPGRMPDSNFGSAYQPPQKPFPDPKQWRHGQQHQKLRRSSSMVERTTLMHRMVHVRGLLDSVLPIYTPNTIPRRCWDMLVMALVVWTAVTVPLSVSFGMPMGVEWDAVNYTVTLMFVLDLFVNFRTAFFNYQGEIVRDSRAIAANYMKFWFWIDLFGTIPFDSIILWTGVIKSSSNNSTELAALGFLKAPRMLRLGRLLRFLDSFKNAKIFRIVQLFLAMILLSHWLACIWYMMYRYGGKDTSSDWAFEEVTNNYEGDTLTYYMVTYYFSFLLLVGDNILAYNNYERTFFVIVLIAGTFFYSAVVGQMATLVATMNVAVNRHGQKLLMVQDALRYAGVPDEYSEKVQKYFEYLQQRSHPGAEGMQFLQELPTSLHLNLCQFLHLRSLHKVPLFKDCEQGFMNALALRIRMISLSPSEVIFRVGDVGKEMYVIKKGCVAVTSPTHMMWGLLQPGEIFGEVALLSTGKRTANCTALGFVDLAVLSGPDLQAVMRDYPVSAAMIHARAAERARSLQTKSKMWLEVSDDEENDFQDCWEGESVEGAEDDAAGDGEREEAEACATGEDGDTGSVACLSSSSSARSTSRSTTSSSSSGSGGGRGGGCGPVSSKAKGLRFGSASDNEVQGPRAQRHRKQEWQQQEQQVQEPQQRGEGETLVLPQASDPLLEAVSPLMESPRAFEVEEANGTKGQPLMVAWSNRTKAHADASQTAAAAVTERRPEAVAQAVVAAVAGRYSAPVMTATATAADHPQHPLPPGAVLTTSSPRVSSPPSRTATSRLSSRGSVGAAATAADRPPSAVRSRLGPHSPLAAARPGPPFGSAAPAATLLRLQPSSEFSTPRLSPSSRPTSGMPSRHPAALNPIVCCPGDSSATLATYRTAAMRRRSSNATDIGRGSETGFGAEGLRGQGQLASPTPATVTAVAAAAAVAYGALERSSSPEARRRPMSFWTHESSSRRTRGAAGAGLDADEPPEFNPKQDGEEIVWLAPRRGRSSMDQADPGLNPYPQQNAQQQQQHRHHHGVDREYRRGGTVADGPEGAPGNVRLLAVGLTQPVAEASGLSISSPLQSPLPADAGATASSSTQHFGPHTRLLQRQTLGSPLAGGGSGRALDPDGASAAAATARSASATAVTVAADIAGDRYWETAVAAMTAVKDPASHAKDGVSMGGGPRAVAEAIEPVGITAAAPLRGDRRSSTGSGYLALCMPATAATPTAAASTSTTVGGAAGRASPVRRPSCLRRTSTGISGPGSPLSPTTAADSPLTSAATTVLLPTGAAILRLSRRSSGINHTATATPPSASPSQIPFAAGGIGSGSPSRRQSRLCVGVYASEGLQFREASAGGAGSGTSDGDGEGFTQEPEWISARTAARTPGSNRRYRRGSVGSLCEEELAALAPSAYRRGASGPCGAASSRRYHGSSIERQLDDEPSGCWPGLNGAAGGGGGGNSSRRSSQLVPGMLSPACSGLRSLCSSGSGMPPQPRLAHPPPPPPDGVFVPRASWNQLLTAVSRLSWFEDAVQQLMELVVQQEEALDRLEVRAARAAALGGSVGGAGGSGVLGIVSPDVLVGGASAAAAATGGGSGSVSTTGAAASLAAAAAVAAGHPVLRPGLLPPMASAGQQLSLQQQTSVQEPDWKQLSRTISGEVPPAGAAGAKAARQHGSGGSRMRGIVRAMVTSSRIRNLKPAPPRTSVSEQGTTHDCNGGAGAGGVADKHGEGPPGGGSGFAAAAAAGPPSPSLPAAAIAPVAEKLASRMAAGAVRVRRGSALAAVKGGVGRIDSDEGPSSGSFRRSQTDTAASGGQGQPSYGLGGSQIGCTAMVSTRRELAQGVLASFKMGAAAVAELETGADGDGGASGGGLSSPSDRWAKTPPHGRRSSALWNSGPLGLKSALKSAATEQQTS